MRSGQPGVPSEDNWLGSSEGAALDKGERNFYNFIMIKVSKFYYLITYEKRAEYYQRSMYSFYTHGAQKHKKDSQVFSLFTLLGSTSVKAERKYVGEIEPR